MIVCTHCDKEMKCTRTGRPLVYRGNHVYFGDEYTCPVCGAGVVHSNAKPTHMDDALKKLDESNPIDMSKGKDVA